MVEIFDNLLRVCLNLVQGLPAIQVLAAGDIPNLGGLQVFHIFRDSVRRVGILCDSRRKNRRPST
jgi:hypothetical protein